MAGILRPLTKEEKEYTKELVKGGVIDFERVYHAKVGEVLLKATIDKIPFCVRCANREFEDEVQRKANFLKKTNKTYDEVKDQVNIKIKDRDFSKYMGEHAFEMVSETPVHEKKFVDGSWVPYHIGWNVAFKCKTCGAGYTVYAPTREEEKKLKFEGLPWQNKKPVNRIPGPPNTTTPSNQSNNPLQSSN